MFNDSDNNDMKKTNNILTFFAAILILLAIVFGSQGQTKDSTYSICRTTKYAVTVLRDTTTCKDTTVQVPVQPSALVQAHYLNSIGSWYWTGANQDAVIRWLLSNGDNRVYIYSVDGYIGSTSRYQMIARFNDSCSAHGIETYFVWSNPTTVTSGLDKFQKAQTRQSAKFDGVISELEPYQAGGSYTLFWSYSRQVKNWAAANNIPTGVYVGWHTQQSTDSMVVLYNFVNLHCYIQSKDMGNAVYEYNYTKSRMVMFANACVKMNVATYNSTIIFSDETAFAYTYYVANKLDLKAPYTAYVNGFNASQNGATALIKSKIKPIGYTTFTSSYSMKIKPVQGLSTAMMRMIEQPHKRKILMPNGSILER